jgi:predicted nucleic acid-binding protein
MGLMVDTNLFIRFEKSGKPIECSSWELSEKVYISNVVVSELLMGTPCKHGRAPLRSVIICRC